MLAPFFFFGDSRALIGLPKSIFINRPILPAVGNVIPRFRD